MTVSFDVLLWDVDGTLLDFLQQKTFPFDRFFTISKSVSAPMK